MERVNDLFFGWELFAFSISVLLFAGGLMVSDEFKHFKAARMCFVCAGVWTYGKVIMWGLFSQDDSKIRMAIVDVACALVGIGFVELMRVTTKREQITAGDSKNPSQSKLVDHEASTSITQPLVASIVFKHTAITFYQKYGSAFVAGKPIIIKTEYENTSDGTAREVSANGVLRLIEIGDDQLERENQEWTTFRNNWLSTIQGTLKTELDGHKGAFFDTETEPLSSEEAQTLKSVRKVVYFFGAVKWSDSTGVYETDICTYFLPDQHGGADAPAIWHDGLSGHNSVRRLFQTADIVAPFSQRANVQVFGMDFVMASPAIGPLEPEKPFFLNVSFKNAGPIPANKIAMFVRLGISTSASEQTDQNVLFKIVEKQAKESGYGQNSLLPGKSSVITAQYPLTMYGEKPVSASDIAQIKDKDGDKQIVVAIIFKYVDEYGPRETHLCQSYRGLSWRYWIDCYGNNEIVP